MGSTRRSFCRCRQNLLSFDQGGWTDGSCFRWASRGAERQQRRHWSWLIQDPLDFRPEQSPGAALFIVVLVLQVVASHSAAGEHMVLAAVDHVRADAERLHHRHGRAAQIMRRPLAVRATSASWSRTTRGRASQMFGSCRSRTADVAGPLGLVADLRLLPLRRRRRGMQGTGLSRPSAIGRTRTVKDPFGQLLRHHLGQDVCSASPDGSFAIARIAIAKDPATSNDRFVAATVARSTWEAATRVEKGAVSAPTRPIVSTRAWQSERRQYAEQPTVSLCCFEAGLGHKGAVERCLSSVSNAADRSHSLIGAARRDPTQRSRWHFSGRGAGPLWKQTFPSQRPYADDRFRTGSVRATYSLDDALARCASLGSREPVRRS